MMGMKGFTLLLGTVAAGAMLTGCVTGPNRSPNPMGHPNPDRDLATQEQFPLKSSAEKEEVDRQFEEQYPGVVNWVWVWGKDRWMDLLDVVSWDVSFGRGFGVNAHLTEYAQAGIGWWDGKSMGMRGRVWGTWDESNEHRGLGPFYWVEVERTPDWGTQSIHDNSYKYTGWDLFEESGNRMSDDDWADVGASANLLAVGARAGASPIEAVDFVAGLIPVSLITNIMGYHQPVFDIQGDDTWAGIEEQLREEKGLGE